jgi:hypothetical protein
MIIRLSRLIPGLRMLLEPIVALRVPSIEFCLRQGICEPPRHKAPHMTLLPMRQIPSMRIGLGIFIEKGGILTTGTGARTFLSVLQRVGKPVLLWARTFLSVLQRVGKPVLLYARTFQSVTQRVGKPVLLLVPAH